MSDGFEFEGATWNLEAVKKALEGKKDGVAHMVVWDKTTQGYNFWFKWHYAGTNDAKAREYLQRVLDAAAAAVPAASFDPLNPARYRTDRALDAAARAAVPAASFDPLKPVRYRTDPSYELRLLASNWSGERPLLFAVKRKGEGAEYIIQRRTDGRLHANHEKDEDVINYTPKKTGWLAHWKSGNDRHTSYIYDTREEVLEKVKQVKSITNAVIIEIPEYEP